MKNNKVYGIAVAASLFSLASCSDITEIYKEWINDGETVYVGKVDSLVVHGGLNRLQVAGHTRYMRSAEKCIIAWDDQKREYAVSEIADGDSIRVTLEDMPEGSYQIFVNTLDREGNRSIVEEVFGYSYGDRFINTQNPKRIVNSTANFSGATISWSDASNVSRIKLEYNTKDGKPATMEVPGNSTETLIEDWEWGGTITATSYVLPERGALDLIPLPSVEGRFVDYPIEKVPTSKFAVYKLPTDINGNGWGTSIKALWDGVMGSVAANGYHNESAGMPHHFTIDMGVHADLICLETYGRDNNNVRNPRHFQVWGRETIEGAETSLSSQDAGWEQQMRDKGWVLLCDGINTDNYYNKHMIDPEIGKNIRYIRYRAIESWSSTEKYSCLQELVLYSNKEVTE